nr:hypothetical protein [Phytoactinopolyspora mesophila]
MRGLTHRAVDRTARLPEGSTSYYFRTRYALLRAIVDQLVEHDAVEIPALTPGDLDQFADAAAVLVHQWLTVGRDRQLARYELSVESTRRPELRAPFVVAGARIRAMVAAQLEAAGVGEAEEKADDFSAFLDGLVFDEIAGAGRRGLSVDRLRGKIQAMLNAVTS